MSGTAYVVERKGDDPGPEYRAVFTNREAAEEHARRLDREFKRATNPVEPNPLHEQRLEDLTSLPEFALRDWLLDADIPPPAVAVVPTNMQMLGLTMGQKEEEIEYAGRRVWLDWWQAVMIGRTLSAEQTTRVWEAFNLYSFYQVSAVTAPEVEGGRAVPGRLFAVVQRHWVFNDSFHEEHQHLLRVYRTREAAEAECRRMEIDTAPPDEDGGDDWYRFTVVELEHNPAEN